MKNKVNAFTLIELLAVIVILAIIALIATPIVINIIEDVKVSSIKRSSELYINAVELTLSKAALDKTDITTCEIENDKLKCEEKEYEIELRGEYSDYVEISATKEGRIYTAIKQDGYCIMKTEKNDKFSYKKLVDEVTDYEIEADDGSCSLNPIYATNKNCFAFDSSTGTITDYYNYENNDKMKSSCPRDVVIPKKINGVGVKIIGNQAFYNDQLTSVKIPSSVTSIENNAFFSNGLTSLIIPEGVTRIGASAFYNNKIHSLSLPSTLTTINAGAFNSNPLTSVTIKNKQENITIGNQAFGSFDVNNIVWDYVEE